MSKIQVYCVVSLDGFIAGSEDDLSWLGEPSPAQTGDPGTISFEAFLGQTGALIMGRRTFDVVMGFGGDWPYGAIPVLIATTRPLPDVPTTVSTCKGNIKDICELTWIKADFRGWVMLPESIQEYKVSPYNFKVDRTRVKKLVEDSMSAVENDVDFSQYQHIIVTVGAFTTSGKGYGMICYCANPGMLSGVRKKTQVCADEIIRRSYISGRGVCGD